jgi:hypothetical protein
VLLHYRKSTWRAPPRRHKHPRLHHQLDAKEYLAFAVKQVAFGDRDAKGRTPVDLYLGKEGKKMKPLERKLLEAQRRVRMGVWRIERVVAGDGFDLSSVRTGERVFVHEVGLSPIFIG